jgi:hypothetical protein
MYCPECSTEYRAGFHQCSDCGVSLVNEPPASTARDLDAAAGHVVVFESPIPGEAEMVAGALEEAGIPPTARRSIAGGLQLGMLEGGLTPGQSMAVSVPLLAEARARTLISELRPAETAVHTPSEPILEAPLTTGIPSRGKAVARVVLAIILIPLGLFILNAIVALLTAALQ